MSVRYRYLQFHFIYAWCFPHVKFICAARQLSDLSKSLLQLKGYTFRCLMWLMKLAPCREVHFCFWKILGHDSFLKFVLVQCQKNIYLVNQKKKSRKFNFCCFFYYYYFFLLNISLFVSASVGEFLFRRFAEKALILGRTEAWVFNLRTNKGEVWRSGAWASKQNHLSKSHQ